MKFLVSLTHGSSLSVKFAKHLIRMCLDRTDVNTDWQMLHSQQQAISCG
jgi:hypothetical protein